MRFYKTPGIIKSIFPQFVWEKPVSDKVIYLTFDDGPIPDITDFVLDQLDQFQAKATFFCVGGNLLRNSELAKLTFTKGHQVANHTFNHLNGWKSSLKDYSENIEKCDELLTQLDVHTNKKLFRPPYGKLTFSQSKYLIENRYKVIMWDVLTYDFDKTLQPENCLKNVIKYTSPGSVILFHDSIKAAATLKFVLPRYLEYFSEKGFTFQLI